MMVQRRHRTTREITGPTPHSVAILARPKNTRPPEHLILERRRKEDARAETEKLAQETKIFDLKNDWEKWTDKKIQMNTVNRRMKELMQQQRFSLEDRRERLRELLSREEVEYLSEMAAAEETVLERQAKMRDRARVLKEKRESERQEIVQQKLEQQWREQCEELRGTLSKRNQDIVAAERVEQLRHKEALLKQREQEERMYADLWHADMLAKAKREEDDAQRQMSANREMVGVLQKQMAALDAKKQEEKRLVEEEARLLKEEAELRKLEDLKAQQEKRFKQQQVSAMYDKSLRIKKEKEARELQEQLAFDMRVLEQLLEESKNEAMEQTQRKKELREENRRYRAYLEQIKREEAEREKELDRLCDAEVEKMWEKRVKQWKLEKEARRRLLQEVMQSRRVQLQEKLQENLRRQSEAAAERDALLRKIEENKALERQMATRVRDRNLNYQEDLVSQIRYNQSLKRMDEDEEARQFESQQAAEREYQTKLQIALDNPTDPKMHPVRRWAITKQGNGLGVVGGRSGGMNA